MGSDSELRVEEREAEVKEGEEAEGRGEAMPNPKQHQTESRV